eukprot:8381362-Pyramimonas_sp.AAC.1
MPNQTAACTRTETRPTAWVLFTNSGEYPEGVGMPKLTRGNLSHGWLRTMVEVSRHHLGCTNCLVTATLNKLKVSYCDPRHHDAS